MIFILLALIILIFLIVIYVDKDFFSPSAIICESYLLAVLCAILNIKRWKINLGTETVEIILEGILIFVVISLFIIHTTINGNKDNKKKENKIELIEVNKFNYKILVLIQIVTVAIYFFYLLKAVGGIGVFANFSSLMNYYRENTAYGELEMGIPTYVNQLVKISKILACISIYIIIRNSLIRKKYNFFKNENITMYLISIISFISLSLLSGGRFGVISYCLTAIVMWKILSDRIFETKNKIEVGKIFKVIGIVIIVIITFSQLRNVVGRDDDAGIVEYVSGYFGGSIQLFDMFLKNPIEKSYIFGKETFYGMNRILFSLNNIEPYKMHLEFRKSNGIVIGNVYTSFRNFYYDFGFKGIIILQSILAIFWSLFYKKLRKENDVSKFDFPLIIYCMFIDKLFLHSYRDTFFSTVITVSTITILIYLWIIKKIVIKGENKHE